MKSKLLLILIFGFSLSCSDNDNDNDNSNEVFGNWKLVKMTNASVNSETTGTEMEWQESYLLNADGTFQKYREIDGARVEAIGTYTLTSIDGETRIELSFNKESHILGSCYSKSLKEEMILSSGNMFYSTWANCDGPGLEYKKID